MTNNFYALLSNDDIRRITLTQSVIPSIRNVFVTSGSSILNANIESIRFDGNYIIEDEEILYVDMVLPEALMKAMTNPITLNELNLSTDKIKTLFWHEEGSYYFQNFDNRKLLRNRNVIFYDKNTYDQLEEDAFIVDNIVNAIFQDGRFYFKSYANANKIFSLIDYFQEATSEEVSKFAENDVISVDGPWLIQNTNSLMRKQITLLLKSDVLSSISTKKVSKLATKFQLKIELDNAGRMILPNDKKHCKDVLTFLNEQFYIGLLSGNKYRTNSKRKA